MRASSVMQAAHTAALDEARAQLTAEKAGLERKVKQLEMQLACASKDAHKKETVAGKKLATIEQVRHRQQGARRFAGDSTHARCQRPGSRPSSFALPCAQRCSPRFRRCTATSCGMYTIIARLGRRSWRRCKSSI